MEPTWESMPEGLRKIRFILAIIAVTVVVVGGSIVTSIINVGGSEVGIVERKFGGGELPQGRVMAVNGENGIQAQILMPGLHLFYWPWQYKVVKVPMLEIKEGQVGLVQALDGKSLPGETIYAPEWDDPEEMQKAEYFLGQGNGYKGPQLSILKPGKYPLNTKLFKISFVPITNVTVGTVAVIKSNVGKVVEVKNRLVKEGQRGIWDRPLSEGKYRLHTKAYEVTIIDIRQVKVSYSAEKESGERSAAQPMRPITVRSKDGYTFPVDVRVTYQIEQENTPLVVATIGGDDLVLTKLVTPTVRAIFRNNAGKVKALEYVQNRPEQEKQSAAMLRDELTKYGITVLAVRIGDVGDEKTLGALLKTQTDREIALQEQETFAEQQRAAEKQKQLLKTQQEATEEKRLATAAYNVKIAEQEKQQVIIDAQAEAEQVKLIAEAKAKAYELISQVIGSDNAALIEIMKLVAERKIKITPDVMVGSSKGGMTDALMGTVLQGMLNKGGQPPTGKSRRK